MCPPLAKAAVTPDTTLLADPHMRQVVGLKPDQTRQVADALQHAEQSIRRERSRHSITAAISHRGMVLQQAHSALDAIALTPDQARRLIAATIHSRGAYLLWVPGLRQELGVAGAQAARIEAAITKVDDRWRLRLDANVRRAHPRMFNTKGGIKVPERTPEVRRLEAERDKQRWQAIRGALRPDQLKRLTELMRPYRPG